MRLAEPAAAGLSAPFRRPAAATLAVHGDTAGRDTHGALRTPVYHSVAFEHPDARSMRLTFTGRKPAHAYSRISNPTVTGFEQRMAAISGGIPLAFASGMAAISATILALAGTGTNIVTSRNLFGNTASLMEQTLRPWGLETRYADMTDPDAVREAIDSRTRMVFFETISNPALEVADCERIAAVCRERGVPLVLDNTVMTPLGFDSGKAGAAVEIISSTKYISGGGVSVGGLVIDNRNFDWKKAPALAAVSEQYGPMAFIARLRQEVHRNLGGCMSPESAYFHTLGLETLEMRMRKSFANALAVARFLENHPTVRMVNYPGLESSKGHGIAKKQFRLGAGGVLTFDLKDEEECFRLLDALRLIRRASNINDNKTLAIHPASTIFAEYSPARQALMGVRPTMIRLSLGIEETEDIISDLERGLDSL